MSRLLEFHFLRVAGLRVARSDRRGLQSFDILAKRTSQRFVAARTFGFTYHEEATRGSARRPVAMGTVFDSDNRVMRYRAKPSVCNTCPIKDTCTVSANWPRTHPRSGRQAPPSRAVFHRGLAVAVSLGGYPRGAAIVWHLPAGAPGGGAVVVVFLSLTYLLVKLSRSPRTSRTIRHCPTHPPLKNR